MRVLSSTTALGLGLTPPLRGTRLVHMEDTYFDTYGDAASDYDSDDYIEPDPYGDWVDDAWAAQFDDDPNPYHGDYSEC